MINETLARRAHENRSFRDYKPGEATTEYNAVIADVTAKIEAAKLKVSPEAQTRLDSLLEWYKRKYAEWTNNMNKNGAGHVSVMISGPSGFNHRAHEKYLNRERKLWQEYDELKNIERKISAIVHGDKIIKSDDADAVQKLQDKLTKALEEHQGYKDHNVKARKEGTETLPSWVLSNSNGRIKAIKDRIARLERLAAKAEATPIEERTTEVNGIQIIDNIEANRLQIIFPGKPDADTRAKLKKAGFRWSPTNGAWQSYRNYHAEARAREIIESL